MILLVDIGNTHTHVGWAKGAKITKAMDVPTCDWFNGQLAAKVTGWARRSRVMGVAYCSVVPKATVEARKCLRTLAPGRSLELTCRNPGNLVIDYPQPKTIGPDRLANAVALKNLYGAPAIAVDFGTAVTFDVLDGRGQYVGGIIAPGVSALTDYLHEKTALLPKVALADVPSAIGKNTAQAMQIGVVHGYRGLIRGLLEELFRELGAKHFPVVATGGYAELISAKVPAITHLNPNLTLEGLRLAWQNEFGVG